MIILIFIMLVLFSIALAFVWVWFFKNEKIICQNYYKEGLNELEKGDYKKAKEAFLRLNILNPAFEELKYHYGSVLLNLKEYSAAKDCFEQVLKVKPKNFDALFSLAQVYQFQKYYDKAEELYRKALKENEQSSSCHFNLGLIFYYQKDYSRAMELFQKAKEISSEDVNILFYINRCNDETCDYDATGVGEEIIEEYVRLSVSPDLPVEFNISLATAYAKTGKLKESLIYCQKALISNPDDVESYKLLGLIQFLKNDFVGAKNNLSTALHLQSKNKEVHEILSYVLCNHQNKCSIKKCREEYHELIKKFLE